MDHPKTHAVLEYAKTEKGVSLIQKHYRIGDLVGIEDPVSENALFETNDEIAFLFHYNEQSPEKSVLLKHGTARDVHDFVRRAGRKDELVISGHFQVEDLNKIINVSGYIGRFYSEIQKHSTPTKTRKFEASGLGL